MKNLNYFKIGLLLIIQMLLLVSCIPTIKITEFPSKANDINFESLSTELNNKETPFWTSNTSNEYYIETNKEISKNVLSEIIKKALSKKGYRINVLDPINNRIIGKRGLRANEWNSMTAIYYQTSDICQIYINTKITQDATGGWRENRAKKVGKIIEALINELK